MGITFDDVRAALSLEDFDAAQAQGRMAPQVRALLLNKSRPSSPRQASVLVLLYPGAQGLSLVLVRRSENEDDVHSGQIGLPGGAREDGENPVETALREAREEIGLRGEVVTLAGQLTPLYIPPSHFEVHPIVGFAAQRPDWTPDPAEVAEIIECPVAWLLDDARHIVEEWDLFGHKMQVPWYNVAGHKVWGATAIMLSELEQRLKTVVVR